MSSRQRCRRSPAALPQAWDDAITGWCGWLEMSGLAATTRRLRRDHVRAIARRSHTSSPAALTREILWKLCEGQPWSPEHRKALRASLISFYRWCVEVHGCAQVNVGLSLPRVKPDTARPRPAPDHAVAALMGAAGPRETLMGRLAVEAGLRRAEIARAHADDLYDDAIGPCLRVVGKGGRQRVVPITESLAGAIRAQALRGYLFPGDDHGHLSPEWVGSLLSALMPPRWTAHTLRHRYASRGYADTGDLRAVQENLGHASVATTQRYTATSDAARRAVSEAAARGRMRD